MSKEKEVMRISEIELRNGNDERSKGRTVSSETGLSPSTPITFSHSQSRWTGTAYRDDIYHITGTDDALIIHHYAGPNNNVDWDKIEIRLNYFADRRDFGERCRAAAKEHGLPVTIALAVGPDLCEEFANLIAKIHPSSGATGEIQPYVLDDYSRQELSRGVVRRKKAIMELLPDASDELHQKFVEAGQVNSTRIADFILNLF